MIACPTVCRLHSRAMLEGPHRCSMAMQVACRCSVTVTEAEGVKSDLGKDAVDRGHADEAAGERHDAQQEEVIVVRGGLLQPELRLLRHLGRHGVVEEEQQRDHDGRQQGCSYVGSRDPPQILHQY